MGEKSEIRPARALSPNVTRRIPELDGLRGFAILIVVLLHYFYKPGVPAPPVFTRFQSLFRLGWTGVDLFFVLSGFLIGGILLNARDSPNYFKTFYIRRFFRIIPILLPVDSPVHFGHRHRRKHVTGSHQFRSVAWAEF
jgi:peptidoglycan/LPS O-acetylase OafA/YrhL